jgi:hypothetical protein
MSDLHSRLAAIEKEVETVLSPHEFEKLLGKVEDLFSRLQALEHVVKVALPFVSILLPAKDKAVVEEALTVFDEVESVATKVIDAEKEDKK